MGTSFRLLCALAVIGASRPSSAAPACQGDYAEDLSALSSHARDVEAQTPPYSYAVRATAVYECVAYGADGTLRRTRTSALAYGTAFGLRADGGDTLLVTNQHVAEWPAVTDDEHGVEGVPAGCKRVADALRIVDDDHDEYAADDVPLTRVVVDPTLDIAVLRAHAQLQTIPWKIGHSAGVAARAAVLVKGFPLGEFRATNVGKVISAFARDTQGDWSHDDFVVDALLTSGGSGSPVLAVSCQTGELELVGVFHARYSSASALNVVVAIDQLHDLLTTLTRSPRPASDATSAQDAAARRHLSEALRADPDAPFFAVGGLVASVHERADGSFAFALFPADFPRAPGPVLALEDAPGPVPAPGDAPPPFGRLGAIYVRGPRGLAAVAPADLDADTRAAFTRALTMLRTDALAALDVRAATRVVASSRAAADRTAAKRRALARMLEGQRDAAQALVDLAGRTAPGPTSVAITLAELEAAGASPRAP